MPPTIMAPITNSSLTNFSPVGGTVWCALYSSFFEPFITYGQLDESMSQYFQPDGIHPNATGVKMVVESVGPIVMEMIAQAVPN